MTMRPFPKRLASLLLTAALTAALLPTAALATGSEAPAQLSIAVAAEVTAEPTAELIVLAPLFGNQLSANAKIIYGALCQSENIAKMHIGAPIVITSFPLIPYRQSSIQAALSLLSNQAGDAVAAFDRDHTEFFWLGAMQASVSVQGVVNQMAELTLTITFALGNDWTRGGRNLVSDIAALQTGINAIVATAPAGNRYEKLRYFHHWLTTNNRYQLSAARNPASIHTDSTPWKALSAVDPTLSPVCEGYARAFKLFCEAADIPCVLVSGTSQGTLHMWNYVQMEDGSWYAVDTTWDDPVSSAMDGVRSGLEHEDYFLVGTNTPDRVGVLWQKSHRAIGNNFITGQTVQFQYPTLSGKAYPAPIALPVTPPAAA